uniref:Uncharacterized protein n=1 Tax=Tupiella akineta TaxID=160070 RepID=Q6UVQ1_TUPAK|nr:hypothetical protein PsakpMp60 [Tupiella akineta]AAQ18773.1 hypothetical protein [Tupiella akineta]
MLPLHYFLQPNFLLCCLCPYAFLTLAFALPPKFVSLRTNCFCAAGKICSFHSQTKLLRALFLLLPPQSANEMSRFFAKKVNLFNFYRYLMCTVNTRFPTLQTLQRLLKLLNLWTLSNSAFYVSVATAGLLRYCQTLHKRLAKQPLLTAVCEFGSSSAAVCE